MSLEYEKYYTTTDRINLNKENSTYLKKIIKENYEVKESLNNAETTWILNSLKWRIVSKIKIPNIIKKL